MNEIKTTEEYWDCEYKDNYIHHKSQTLCHECNSTSDEQPDSRVDEVLLHGLPLFLDTHRPQQFLYAFDRAIQNISAGAPPIVIHDLIMTLSHKYKLLYEQSDKHYIDRLDKILVPMLKDVTKKIDWETRGTSC